ncbi:MAG: von Willebrand factor type A domain-containing protein, partial [Acidobacteria bacterium]|nr:von Willebrand factor type A domain-containing protein [Acidobacteriota bacterium]
MKIDDNDPRWTAYALGEISDEKERAELEQILKESEEIRQMVDEIRRTADLLNDGLKYESPAVLTEAQRDRIESQGTKRTGWIWSRPVWALSGVAAMLILTVSVWMFQLKTGGKDSSVPETLMTELHTEDAVPVPEAEAVTPGVPEVQKMEPTAETDLPAESTAGTTGKSRAALTKDSNVPAQKPAPPENASKVPNVELAMTSVTVAAEVEDVLMESNASVGQVVSETKAKDLHLINSNALDLIKVMGGTNMTSKEIWEADQTTLAGVGADQVDVQRDGVTVNDGVYREGVNSLVKLNPEQLGKIKLVTEPVDAEMGRGSGQVQVVTRPGVNAEMDRRRYPAPPPPPPRPKPRWPDERRMPPIPREEFNTESYENIVDNPFLEVTQNPLSTFSIDVDTASYSNIRRFLEDSQLPPKDAVRIEELVNYFDYDYRGPDNEDPFAARFEMTEAPWNKEHKLLRIGLKALEMDAEERPATNLVFLIDVSGSMSDRNKLPLVKGSLHMLVDRLTGTDHVAIVTYAGSTRVALPSTRGDQKWSIHRAIDYLRSGGSTAGASGIQLAYETALKNLIDGGANRVILATDGDFNVGITSHGELTRLIEEKAESGVFLTALGFGMGNYKDDTLELLADKGRGNYAYIDTIEEAKKVLVEQINATLVSVAKDVKIQVEFNPGRVGAYRLIGYEDRVMPKEDFNDD